MQPVASGKSLARVVFNDHLLVDTGLGVFAARGFNVLSGVYRAASGSVDYDGRELTGMPPHAIAGLGVARTFQNIVLTAGTVADPPTQYGSPAASPVE